jgi:hypothetical protein
MFHLPGYCPDLNPNETLSQDVNNNALGPDRQTPKSDMRNIRSYSYCRKQNLVLLRNISKLIQSVTYPLKCKPLSVIRMRPKKVQPFCCLLFCETVHCSVLKMSLRLLIAKFGGKCQGNP